MNRTGVPLREVSLVCLAVGVTATSYGATATASGFPWWVPVVLAVTVLAGSAEFLFVGIVAAGGGPIAAAVAGLLVNARHLAYGLSIADVVGTGWRRLLGSHVMNDESVVLALARPDPAARRAAYWASGLGVLVCWPAGAALGALLGSAVPDTAAIGLDAMFPAILLALVLPALREARVARAAVAGAVIAVATTPFLPAGLPVLLALLALPLALPPRTAGGDR